MMCRELAQTPVEHGREGYRFNDGKPSPSGVLFLGRKHESSEEADGKRGRLYALEWTAERGQSKLTEVCGLAKVFGVFSLRVSCLVQISTSVSLILESQLVWTANE